LVAVQDRLARRRPTPWQPPNDWSELAIGACFVCFERGTPGPGRAGERGWAATAAWPPSSIEVAVAAGAAPAPYQAGLLALREAPLLSAAVDRLAHRLDVLIVAATGRDHPRRAGMALHLGAVLGVPTIGVTNRPLAATGEPPDDSRLARSPILLDDEEVGYWLRTRPRRNPIAVHAAWRTDAETAVTVVSMTVRWYRTPEPLRAARRAARLARAGNGHPTGR